MNETPAARQSPVVRLAQYAGALVALAIVFGGVANLYKAATLENKDYANEAATSGGVLLLVGLAALAGVAWLLRRGRRTS